VLPTWDQALDAIGDYDEPRHVARFGQRFDAQGVLAGSRDASRCIGYLTKYLTKHLGNCHQAATDAQADHAGRLAEALRYEPCSPACANWLRCGVQPKNARPGLIPGRCKGKAHRREYLGYAGRRVLVSRKWSGKTLADHRADRKAWLTGMLELPATDPVGTAGNRSSPATPTTCPPGSGYYASPPTASNGRPHWNRPADELLRPTLPRTGRPHDQPTRPERGRALDGGGGGRAAEYFAAIHPPTDRRTAHRIREGRPSRADQRIRAHQLYRRRTRRAAYDYPNPAQNERSRVMPNREGHRRFGNVRRRESGRYQIRYPGPDGRMRTGPETYERKSDADRALVMVEARTRSGDWTDPECGKVKLGDYGSTWITERPGLRPRTMDLYRWLLRKHIEPYLGGVPVGKLSTRQIREWRAALLSNGVEARRR
jgi:hypothetical protein